MMHRLLALTLLASALAPGLAQAQAPAAADRSLEKMPVYPITAIVTLAHYQKDKQISSEPYTLAVTVTGFGQAVGKSSLRMGTNVPVPTSTPITPPASTGAGAKPAVPVTPFTYQEVGTNIDCTITTTDGVRFVVGITVGDSSVVEEASRNGKPPLAPSFRRFSITNSMVLSDGGTGVFTSAPDRVTGEVVKVEVALRVVK
jgi:hypothetical protein